jgi:hypothetical protein
VVNPASEVNLEENLNVSFVSVQIFDVNFVNLNEQLGEKLFGDISASNTAEMKKVAMVGSDHNYNCSYDSVVFSSIDVIEINKNNNQALDGVANNVQKKMPKRSHVPTEEEVIAFGGIAPTSARSSVRLQRKDNADDEVMAKAMKLAQ